MWVGCYFSQMDFKSVKWYLLVAACYSRLFLIFTLILQLIIIAVWQMKKLGFGQGMSFTWVHTAK